MDKILMVVFDNESKAYEGSRALQDMHDEGSINLYAKAVIVRDDGNVQVKQSSDIRPVGTAVGLLAGSLIGLFGGPIGLTIGVGTGTLGGLLYDLAELGLSQDFLEEVGQSLKPGKAAIVAEIWEDWTMPVDTKMESLGGVVLRRARRDNLDRHVEWDITTLKAELDELESEYDRSGGEAKTKLQGKIDTARAKLQTTVNRIQARLEASQQETKAKIDSLQEQVAKARDERKAKLEKRITELQAEQKRRNEQLKRAGQHIKETLEA
ncbi:MAG: DUF1269 domain-containing protein [Anaerolineales bacterium]